MNRGIRNEDYVMKKRTNSKQQQEAYDRMMEQGPLRFILIRGVLYWGVTTALIFSLIMTFISPDETFLEILSSAIITFPLGGIVWGAAMWWWMKRSIRLKRERAE